MSEPNAALSPHPTASGWPGLGAWLRKTWEQFGQLEQKPRLQRGVLLVILLLGAVLRFHGINWDEGTHLHPDERFITMVENSLTWPSSLAQYWDTANNPLNPYNSGNGSYVYGLFPVVAAKAVGQLTGFTGYDGVYLAGRALSALMDLGCILLVFLIGKRLYDARVGLLGAFLLSVSVLSIQNSHFFTVDSFTTFFVTLALYMAVRVAQGKGWGSIIGLGFAYGMAVSCKINAAAFLGVIALAFWRRLALVRSLPEDAQAAAPHRKPRYRLVIRIENSPRSSSAEEYEAHPVRHAFWELVVVGLAAFFTFRIVQPQAFNGPGFFGLSLNSQWLGDMAMISKLVSGQIDYPPSHQWANRPPVWYALKNLVLWGQGIPLGLATWFGWGTMAWQMLRKRRWEHVLPWSWMTFLFFYTSVQFVKTVRYLLPIYPTMALIAAYGLLWLYDSAREWQQTRPAPRARWLPAGAAALGVVVCGGTLLWALAFSSIYSRPVTRIAASRWMYDNLPVGSSLTWEEWDDPLPLNIDGKSASMYFNQIKTTPYAEDTPEKRELLYSWLENTDYIVLSSNRLYQSIPRLPLRYPMTTRYYEALFSGELGFDLVQTFTSRPRIFGIEIVDDDADETFTVYDHPKVLIFQKSERFSAAKLRELFGGYDLVHVVRMMPKDVGRAPNGLMLSAGDWQAQQASGIWSAIFPSDTLFTRFSTVTWLVLVYLLGIIAFPYLFIALPHLRDRGYTLSKLLGVLLLGFLAWLLPSLHLVAFSRQLIAILIVMLLVGALAICWLKTESILAYIHERWRHLVVSEIVFLMLFLTFWYIRQGNPDLWHPVMGGEKPMELAYLNAIIKSNYFPPYDPWFAGGYINYYYLGWVLVGTLVKLTGIPTSIAFNLALPTWFAFTGIAVYGLVANLAGADEPQRWFGRSVGYGLLAVFLVLLAGNLGEIQLLFQGWHTLGGRIGTASGIPFIQSIIQAAVGFYDNVLRQQPMPFRPEWWYWNASRIMQNGEINEFPYFTFLYGDLHAHLLALPYTLAALAVALNLYLGREQPTDGSLQQRLRRWPWLALLCLSLILGYLWCANTWDYPTYALLAAALIGLGYYLARHKLDSTFFLDWLGQTALMLLFSYLLYYPFHANYGAAYTNVGLWTGERTSLGALLIIQALPLYILYSYCGTTVLGREARGALARAVRILLPHRRWVRSRDRYATYVSAPSGWYLLGWAGVGIVVILQLLSILLGDWVFAVVIPLVLLSAALVLRQESRPLQRIIGLLSLAGSLLVIGVEYIVLKGDIGRMNTVFKFYLQTWVLWGTASALALSDIVPRLPHWPQHRRAAWQVVLVILMACCATYPLLATPAKIRDRWQPPAAAGLDGAAYMQSATLEDQGRLISLQYDARAIRWLQENVAGTPVIAEASIPPYRWGSRISIYSGLPTIIGWDWHQRQQRAAYSSAVVDWRLEDLSTLYNTLDPATAWEIIQRYYVRYIIAGELEAAYYTSSGLAKFESMVGQGLEIAYRDGPMTIYHVVGTD